MKNKILKQLYIPKVEVELFRSKMEHLIVALSGSNKVEYSTYLDNYKEEEVIVFNTIIYGDSEEEVNKEYEKFKELIQENFGEETKEKEGN